MGIVSIIVPLYKGKKYIGGILKMIENNTKVLEQYRFSYKVELLFINDYPEEKIEESMFDNTIFECQLITNQQNLGIHDSRVVGIEKAKGEFIFLLDQDDLIESNYLYSQIKILEGNPRVPYVICNGYIQHRTYTRPIYEYKVMHRFATNLKAYAYLDNRIISPGQCIIRKSFIPDFWKKNALKSNGADDLLLWLLILSNHVKPAINKERLYTHINTDNNTSLDTNLMYSSVDEMINILKTIKYNEKLVEIIEYRNVFLQGGKYQGRINLISKFIVNLIYFARTIKNHRKS